MKNREKYADKIIDISATSRLALLDGKPVPCTFMRCSRCQFHSPDNSCISAHEWLDSEYVMPPVDWSKVPVDTPVLVGYGVDCLSKRRHFARYTNGHIFTYPAGKTSFTFAFGDVLEDWLFGTLYEEEKVNE